MTKHIWFMDGHCEEDVLHYGVKGMKWGVVRGRRSGGSSKRRNSPLGTSSKGAVSKKKIADLTVDDSYDAVTSFIKSATTNADKAINDVFNSHKPKKKADEYQRIKPEKTGEAARRANPNYKKGYAPLSENYFSSALAAELRRRGIKATAKADLTLEPGIPDDFDNSEWNRRSSILDKIPNKFAEGRASFDKTPAVQYMAKCIKDLKLGNHGIVDIYSPDGGKMLNYSVDNNKVSFYDPVVGKKVSNDFGNNMYDDGYSFYDTEKLSALPKSVLDYVHH